MSYEPSPVDHSRIELAAQLERYIETLARNNHDLWARQRMAEGWEYGPRRDESGKKNPLLVPYDQLSESEKEYDRSNAIESLKLIIALGGKVEAPAAAVPGAFKESAAAAGLWAAWRAHAPLQLPLDAYQWMSAEANRKGEHLIAFDIAAEGMRLWPGDLKLNRMKALALAQSGSPKQANEILLALLRDGGHADPETLGMLARTYKDLWLQSRDPRSLDQAYEEYLKAYDAAGERYWTGINAATLAFASGRTALARSIAARVRERCLELPNPAGGDAYWITATLAEAELVLGDLERAETRYAEASAMGANDLGSIAATRRNARILLRSMPAASAERIEAALNMPKVAVFTGHRIDASDRQPPRFPAAQASQVKDEIKTRLVKLKARIGYASASAGSDILFLEAMGEIGGKTYIVLPCKEEQFIRESVDFAGGDWVERFERVRENAVDVIFASEQRLVLGGIAYDFANEYLHGLAAMRANAFETDLVRMAVWDGRDGDGPGGTADAVRRWQKRYPVEIIRLSAPGAGPAQTPRPPARPKISSDGLELFDSEIRAILFADAKHFSRLSEEEVPKFISRMMGPVADLIVNAQRGPQFQNTWGDGLFLVFETVAEAGRFALEIARVAAGVDRRAAGLPEDLQLRIALHAGPVYRFKDRITGRWNYIGSHVNRAARIEPVTQPGQVYASEAFAALATLEAPEEFLFDYVGKLPLAKDFGAYSIYRLQSR